MHPSVPAYSLEEWLTERGGGGRGAEIHSSRNHREPKEPGDNLFVLFPQVIPRSLVHGQADHCEKRSSSTASPRKLPCARVCWSSFKSLSQDTVREGLLVFSWWFKRSCLCRSSEQTSHGQAWHLPLRLIHWDSAQKSLMHAAAFVGAVNHTWKAKQTHAQNNQP